MARHIGDVRRQPRTGQVLTVMYYMIFGAQAEDDGSAWDYNDVGGRYVQVQVRPLSIVLLRDGLSVLRVGSEIVVAPKVVDELNELNRDWYVRAACVKVRGPQPQLAQRPDMLQLEAPAKVHLTEASIERAADGGISRLKTPFVLAASGLAHMVCKIAENNVTVVAARVKDVLQRYEPTLRFEAIRLDGEDAPAEVVQRVFRMPTSDELKRPKK